MTNELCENRLEHESKILRLVGGLVVLSGDVAVCGRTR